MCGIGMAQKRTVSGIIRDSQSDEPIPFASAVFKKSGRGALTDSSGKFIIELDRWLANDTLSINNVGYKLILLPAVYLKDSTFLTIKLDVLPSSGEAVVKSKYNRALWFWKQIMKRKPIHDKTHWDNYSYEVYNKMEVDIENFKKEKFTTNKLLKPLSFLTDYIDSTSEAKPFLPAYITETLSDYYLQKSPHKAREVIKATRTNGLDNESLVKELGGMYNNVNVYSNTIPVFNKQFISPFNDNGDNFYNFKLLDTQYLSKRRLVHLRFTPKRKGEDTFEGDCWIHDSTFSIQKITLRPSPEADLNFITGLTLIQEFKLVNDTTWFLYKDKFVADVSPMGKTKISLKGRKTTTYKDVVLNSKSVVVELDKSPIIEKIELAKDHKQNSDTFWNSRRHEELSKTEAGVYKMLDTLQKNPAYMGYKNTLQFIARGTKDFGKIRIGPWFYWFSNNQYEGFRTRFDVRTNKDFSKKLYLHGYIAYGFNDQKFKGLAEVKYIFNHQPWTYINVSYKNDIDNGQTSFDQLTQDNIFGTMLRRNGVVQKFQRQEEKRIEIYKETTKGWGFGLTAASKQFEALRYLPGAKFFPVTNGDPLNSFETTLKLRYAYAERTVETNFSRISVGSDFPIVEVNLTKALPGVLNSSYDYNKVDISLKDFLKIAPFGRIYYNLFAGKTFGKAPYNFLTILPGNENSYYNKRAFNLMNRFEYVTDKYAGFNIEHNIGAGLFRFAKFTRKLKLRQSWEAKGIIGGLTDENKKLNFKGDHFFKSLDNKMYLELGTGIDNIFQFFRVDFVWRVLSPSASKETVSRFGVFGSFRFSF